MSPSLTRRVVLGTVQLGLPYGRRASSPLLSWKETAAIFDAAWDADIRTFDTAEAYGEATARLQRWLDERGHWQDTEVVTKLHVSEETLDIEIERAVARIGRASKRGFLTHGAVAESDWRRVTDTISSDAAYVGQSVYTRDEVTAACAMEGVARIQAPANALTLSLIDAAREGGCAFDARSVYLQGLLLELPDTAESRVPGSREVVGLLHGAAREVGRPLAELLVGVVLAASREEDRVVIGVDAPEELQAVVNACELPSDSVAEFARLVTERVGPLANSRILDPRCWQ